MRQKIFFLKKFDLELLYVQGPILRTGEMRESIKIIQQALEGIPGGPYENLEIRRRNCQVCTIPSSWLPDAMEGPTPISALILAATMVAAGKKYTIQFFEVAIIHYKK